ncbi:hypothetical protein GF373_10710, partial [bacterium]|nr:hypothetical protein [bacterium]
MNRTLLQLIASIVVICGLILPSGAAEPNDFDSPIPNFVNGAVSVDRTGHFRTVRQQEMEFSDLFDVNENGVPTQFYNQDEPFFLGFDAYRDLEAIANADDELIGFLALDKFAAVHPFTVTGPSFKYTAGAADYNAGRVAEERVFYPFFGGFENNEFFGLDLDVLGLKSMRGGDNGIARDIELAVDWRSRTNAFQGYYILDVFGGIHYINDPQVLGLLQEQDYQNDVVRLSDSEGNAIVEEPEAYQKFHDIFGFRARYMVDYAGSSPTDDDLYGARAAYWPGLPVARDLEVMVRFEKMTQPGSDEDLVTQSQQRNALAQSLGIDVNELSTPILIDENRNNYQTPVYAPDVAITNGYAILDGFGGVHTLIEDENGNPIPAPWENQGTGAMDPSVNAPYFGGSDIAVDVEVMANNGGYCLLTRTGDVFVVNAVGMDPEDNFVEPGIETELPFFGFDAARNLTLVNNEQGKVIGMYVVDRFGTIHTAGEVPDMPSNILYFQSENDAIDLEISPYARPV